MSEKSIIIIGAGLAGLAAGCYARMNGYKAHIFEHHSVPGGVVASWRRKGFLIDGGIHYLMGFKPGQSTCKLYKELGVYESNRIFEKEKYASYRDSGAKRILTITKDLDKLAADLKAISPKDAAQIDEFIKKVNAFRGLDIGEGMDVTPELMTPWSTVKQTWNNRKFIMVLMSKFGKSVEEYASRFNDPWLAWIFKWLFTPEVPVWFVLMLLALLADGQLGYVEGGSQEFIGAIEKRFKRLGGEITYNATVNKILVENDTACGIRLEDGTEYRGDIVISAADGHSTIFSMLEGKYVDKAIQHRYTNWKLFRPLVMLNIGVNRSFPDEPSLSIIKLETPIDSGGYKTDCITSRLFNYSSRFAPQGKTVVQVTAESDWDFWNELQSRDRSAYEKEKERIADVLLKCIDEVWEGISSTVEMKDVATPLTTWRYTRNHKGAFEGFLPTPKTVMTRVPKTLPGLNNFYMAGQWVMPGGGVPPCLISGRQAVQIICKRDGKNFITCEP